MCDAEPIEEQPEGSHVKWTRGLAFKTWPENDLDEAVHRIRNIRLPNDKFVSDQAVTLEEMRKAGAV